MKQFVRILSALILLNGISFADSLVPSDFHGYLKSGGGIKAGTIIKVVIDSSTKFTYTSAYSDSSLVSLNFSGGEGSGLFSFLPTGDTSHQSNAEGEDESAMNGMISSRVVELFEDGTFRLEGSRQVRIGKASQRLDVSGTASVSLFDENGAIPFQSLADSRLTFTSFSDTTDPVLNPDSFILPGVPSETEDDTAAVTDGTPVPETAPEQQNALRLKNEVRRDLLLQYINQMINLIFSAPPL